MLERITDFLSHPDLIFGSVVLRTLATKCALLSIVLNARSAGEIEDPNERFIQVLRYYLAGWHIKPKGV
jgi:hypothetical protein